MRAGDIVHNCFSYHLTPGAFILEAGAHALGCAVIPGGVGNTEAQLDAIAQLKPTAYVGTPDFLKILLTQLRFQDPLKPVDNEQFVAQLAQFSSLEQLTQINQRLGNQATDTIGRWL